jgi:hypothetical protein
VFPEQLSVLDIRISIHGESIDLLEEFFESHLVGAGVGCVTHGILEMFGRLDEQ